MATAAEQLIPAAEQTELTLCERAEHYNETGPFGFFDNLLLSVISVLKRDSAFTAEMRNQLEGLAFYISTPTEEAMKLKLTKEEQAIVDALCKQTTTSKDDPTAFKGEYYKHLILRELYIITHPSFLALTNVILEGNIDTVNNILAEGIDILATLCNRSILDMAINFNHPNILERLLQYAKEKNPSKLMQIFSDTDAHHRTVLTRAVHEASRLGGHELLQMVKLLLRYGALYATSYNKPLLGNVFDANFSFDLAITLMQYEAQLSDPDQNCIPALVYAWRARLRYDKEFSLTDLVLKQLQLETELAYQTETNSLYRAPNNKEADEIYTLALRQAGITQFLEKEAANPNSFVETFTSWLYDLTPIPKIMRKTEAINIIPIVQEAIKQHVVLPIVQRATLKEPYTSLVACFNHSNTYPEQALNLITEYSHGSYRPSLNFSLFSLHKARFKQLRLEQRLLQLQDSLNETNRVLNEADELLYRVRNGF